MSSNVEMIELAYMMTADRGLTIITNLSSDTDFMLTQHV